MTPAYPLLLAVFAAAPLLSQDTPTWTRTAPLGSLPSTVEPQSMVFDFARGVVLYYGGGQTWTFDGSDWTQLQPATSPTALGGFAMTYDTNRGRAVLYGGTDGNTFFDETWEWDGVTWTLAATTGPGARIGASLTHVTYDGGLLLFGGRDEADTVFGDTWRYANGSWTQLAPAAAPSPRAGHLAAEVADGRVIVFGGYLGISVGASTYVAQDTWQFDPTTDSWSQIATAIAPPGRTRAAGTFDLTRGRIIVHGGQALAPATALPLPMGTTAVQSELLQDTWEFDSVAGTWDNTPPLGTTPGAFQEAMVTSFVEVDGRVIRLALDFGGVTAWDYERTAPGDALYYSFGEGCTDLLSFSTGSPSLEALGASRPALGTTFRMRLRNGDPQIGVAALLMGLSNTNWNGTPLPLALDGFDLAPGCELQVSVDALLAIPTPGGVGDIVIDVPNQPSLVGATIYHQAFVFGASALPFFGSNRLSNGAALVVGS